MRFPSLSRREEPTPTPSTVDDETDRRGAVATDTRTTQRPTGRVDGRERSGTDRTAEQPAVERDAAARAATARSSVNGSRRARAAAPAASAAPAAPAAPADAPDRDRTLDLDRSADRARTADRGTTVDRARTVDANTVDRDPTVERDRVPATDAPAAPVGPRPRTSLLATLGLIVGLAGLGFVLTGTLAGYGIALGAVGAVLAVLGLIATRRRHVAGKADALFGIAFGLGAVVLGVLAMTGQYVWPTTDGDLVARFREWLDSQFVDRF
ncbi:DMT family transporter [Micromonospora endophytica]|uniref:DMT family transporter n=1 Tax=Micromonospora endophytica TaxID=515350 RepID=UPI001C33C5B2|nr:DMT family transporter [Micromonospora endophytica]BCJ60481.1 hypothetical protein Jiend_39030 [Micromonospora endophytica]